MPLRTEKADPDLAAAKVLLTRVDPDLPGMDVVSMLLAVKQAVAAVITVLEKRA